MSATVGQQIELTLLTLGEGEYGTPVVSSTAVTFLGESVSPEQDPGGSRQVFRFEAVAPGSATITADHTGTDPTFSVTIEVS